MFKSKSSKLLKQQQQQQQLQQAAALKQHYLGSNCHRTYSCIHCRAHLANHDELISKLFQGNHGRAYLFNKVVNVGCKQAVERELLTGLHAVADIYCDCCETTLGWKYEQAFVPSQKYKEGKYIIELVHMLKENHWDLTSYNSEQLLADKADKPPSVKGRGTSANARARGLLASSGSGSGATPGSGARRGDLNHFYSAKRSATARPEHRLSFSVNIGPTADDTQADQDNAENHDDHDGEPRTVADGGANTGQDADTVEGKRPQRLQGSTMATTRCNGTTATTRETIRIDNDSAAAAAPEPAQLEVQ